ncbi:AAA family ATPase [Gloeomargarita lithophora Alchichica-D10]|uniref:AAA family ATPase n=2 Tax=Gloeomargarita TaxID=1188227 RepID=A0A1J0A9C2_9CYAN|nr:AAA family ATPase [Gloeomargarita lithophora Alchichica-D10]
MPQPPYPSNPMSDPLIAKLTANIAAVFLGKPQVVQQVVMAVIAGGHILIEDVPGVGKTTLTQAIARSIGGKFQRIQFTSDLLPADILGVTIFDRNQANFEFRPGPIFANVVLADEINRTSPRTQSALLEAMAEQRVSLDDQTYSLPKPFIVLATQNPIEYHGTYPLPESQLDRFLVRLSIGYPDSAIEKKLLMYRQQNEPVEQLAAVLSLEELITLQAQVDQITLDESLVDYILQVVTATRTAKILRAGVSTRGALALVRAAKARALVQGRAYCVPDDVLELLVPVLAHRLSLGNVGQDIQTHRQESEAILRDLTADIPLPV